MTGAPSKITADSVVATGVVVGASVDTGGTISVSNSTLSVTGLGLGVGTGSINATNVNIVLMGPRQTTQIGAQVLNAGGRLTQQRGNITNVTPGGGGHHGALLRSKFHAGAEGRRPV